METVNRSVAPKIEIKDSIQIQEGVRFDYPNGLEAYSINCSDEELVKIDWIFMAGSYYALKPTLATFTNNLMVEGCRSKTAKEIFEFMDFYGAVLRPASDADKSVLTLYCLNKHLEKVLPLVKEIIEEPTYTEDEFELYRTRKINQLKLNNQKGEYIAKNLMDQALYGQDHAYGHYLSEEDFKAITREDVLDFHAKHYTYSNCKLTVSGKVEDGLMDQIANLFGQGEKKPVPSIPERKVVTDTNKVHRQEQKNSVQAAICFGRKSIGKKHPDFQELVVVDTILGGYFGSRLMMNIREDKGYTYGVYSSMVPYIHDSYHYIATEVDKNVANETLNEIKFEMKRLQDELVSAEELEIVRNYILGSFLTSIDGPFALSNRLKGILLFDLSYEYYHNFINTVKAITPERIRELAKQYMNLEDYHEVVVV